MYATLHSRDRPTWAWNIIVFICRWAWFAGIFLKLFTSTFIGLLVCCFLRKFLSDFAVRVILVSLNVRKIIYWSWFKLFQCTSANSSNKMDLPLCM